MDLKRKVSPLQAKTKGLNLEQHKVCTYDHSYFFVFYFSKKVREDTSDETSVFLLIMTTLINCLPQDCRSPGTGRGVSREMHGCSSALVCPHG